MGSSMTTMTSLENPLSSLSSGYFSSESTKAVEDIQVVELQEDDEPSILATKSFQIQQPKNQNHKGYSHLDWCSSFNVAEEPDDVQGIHNFLKAKNYQKMKAKFGLAHHRN